MTGPNLQTQILTPEHEPGLLRNSLNAVRDLPQVIALESYVQNGLEFAQNKISKIAKNRVAIGAVAVVSAAGVVNLAEKPADREASAQEPQQIDATTATSECIKTALDREPTLEYRYLWTRNKAGKKVRTRTMRIYIDDFTNNPGYNYMSCKDYEIKPREFKVRALIGRVGSSTAKMKGNSPTVTEKLSDGHISGGVLFYDRFNLKTKKRFKKGKTVAAVEVTECAFPKNSKPQCSTFIRKKISEKKFITNDPI